MSPQSFSRFFKHAFSKTFIDYVNDLKIYNACRTLLETDQTVTEIAYASGFNNLSNFNEHFRRRKEVTPSQYRSQAREGVSHDALRSANDWLGAFK
jgi:AraC-like DNA-binding protein